MSNRNAGIGRDRNSRGDARHDFKFDAVLKQLFGFFSASAENKGVAALETNNIFSFQGLLYQKPVDLSLGQGMVRGGLAHVYFFNTGSSGVQKAFIQEPVKDDN